MKTRILVSDDSNEHLRTLAHQLQDSGMPEQTQIIYQGRNTIGVLDGLCIKSYKRLGVIKGLIYSFFRLPKAERAYFAAERLRELGIDTPAPRVLVICNKGGRVNRSYYVCDYYDGWETLRGVEKRSDFKALAVALAAFMKDIHSKGVLLKDFSQGNVLFRKDGEGNFHFAVVDINRIRFGVEDRSRLLSAFGKILDTHDGIVTLAQEYAKGTPYTAEDLVAIFDSTQRRLFRNKRIKNYFRKNKR